MKDPRERRLLVRYSLSLADWDKIFQYQRGLCAICEKPAAHFKRRFSVDHDHSTHVIRGLLCFACNRMIPARRDLPDLLRKILAYVENPPAILALGTARFGKAVKRRRKKKK